MVLVLALALSAAMVSPASAKDEFEDGFKTELGAISARAAVGLGVGLVGEIIHGGPHYVSYRDVHYRPYRGAIYIVRPVPVHRYPCRCHCHPHIRHYHQPRHPHICR